MYIILILIVIIAKAFNHTGNVAIVFIAILHIVIKYWNNIPIVLNKFIIILNNVLKKSIIKLIPFTNAFILSPS